MKFTKYNIMQIIKINHSRLFEVSLFIIHSIFIILKINIENSIFFLIFYILRILVEINLININ
jgi:hypothetical protein